MNALTYLASAEAATDSGIFGALGIDWKTLLLQIVAFLILVFLLGKFVYPWLIRSVDERQEKIDASTKAAAEAQAAADDAARQVAELLADARRNATDIVATAKLEATNALSATEAKAKARAEQIVSDAHTQITKDIESAKKALRHETLDLVAQATQTVIGKTLTTKTDQAIITAALKDAQ